MIRNSSLILALCLTGATMAQQATSVSTGTTSVTFSNEFVGAVRSLGLTVQPLRNSQIYSLNGRFIGFFPISDGELDLTTAKGEIFHLGGLRIRNNTTEVRLRSFNIDTTGAAPVLSGLVIANNSVVGRLPLFSIGLPSSFTLPIRPVHGYVNLSGVRLNLTSQAASALNGAFGVTAFTAGFRIGTANVVAKAAH